MPHIDKDGYMQVRKPHHPMARKCGYILLHRFVMSEHLGRSLDPMEVVHHKDGNRQNNEIDNLELFSNLGEHIKNGHPEIAQITSERNKGRPSPKKGKHYVVHTEEFFIARKKYRYEFLKKWQKEHPEKVKEYRRLQWLRNGN